MRPAQTPHLALPSIQLLSLKGLLSKGEGLCTFVYYGVIGWSIKHIYYASYKFRSSADSPCEHTRHGTIYLSRDDCNNCRLVLVNARNISEIMQGKIFVGPCVHLFFYKFAAYTFCQWQFVAGKGSRYSTLQKCLLHWGWHYCWLPFWTKKTNHVPKAMLLASVV